MENEHPARGVGWGAILVSVLLVGSLVGALGWYWITNRKGLELNTSGFDVANISPTAPSPPRYTAPNRPQEGMLIQSAKDMSFTEDEASKPGGASAPQTEGNLNVSREVRKYEGLVRNYAVAMTRRFPSVRQYGKDWMSYPDLRKLNDDYMRNHDPMAFMAGLARSPNFGKLISKYATDSAVRSFVIDGVKQAPPELMATAGDALRSDSTVKALVNNVAQALGLPPGLMAVVNGGTVNQNQVMSAVMSNPQVRGALQGQSAPPVNLPAQQ